MSDLAGRRVLVVGASSGIGRVTARWFAQRGCRVVGTSRRAAWPDALAAGVVTMAPVDVTDQASVDRLVAHLDALGFAPDTLILNAGFGVAGPIEGSSVEAMKAQFDTNVFGVHRMVLAFLGAMRARGSGRVIVVGSLASEMALPFQGLYSSSKGALVTYTRALRQEVMPFGVHISLIEPGDHATDFGGARRRSDLPEAAAAYEPQASRVLALMERAERSGADPARVARAAWRLHTARRPRHLARVVSVPERSAVWLRALLPARLFERFMMRLFEVPRRLEPG